MIEKNELEKVLINNNVSNDLIKKIITGRRTKLYKIGNASNIDKIIKLLTKYNLISLLNVCPSILAFGKADDIEKIIKLLEQKNLIEIVKICPTILAQGKSSEIEKIIKLLENKDLIEMLKICPSILAFGKVDEIEKIIKLLEQKNLIEVFKNCPSILAFGKANEIEKIIKLLEQKNLTPVFKNCPSILAFGKANEIEKIINLLENKDLIDVFKDCPTILARGKANEIEKILNLLESKELIEIVKNCPSILSHGNSSEIEKILNLLESKDLIEVFKNCPTILARGKANEIEKILNLLENKELIEIVKNCPSILSHGKANEIEKILNLLESKELIEIVENCPSVLARGKANEIEKILNLLESKELIEIVKNCPTILILGKASEMDNILKKIDKINGNIKNISPSLLIDYKTINNIIELNRDGISEEEFRNNLKIHLKLISKYNKIYNKDELLELANNLKMNYDELIKVLFKYSNYIYKTLEIQGYIFIGSKLPISEEIMREYQKEIIDVATFSAKSFMKYTHKNNFEDFYDFAIETLLNKCGENFINYGKTSALKPMLYKYLMKSYKVLYTDTSLFNNHIDIDETRKVGSYDNNNEFINEYYYLSKKEQLFLSKMSKYIECGYDYIELLSKEYNIDKDIVKQIIIEIRNKITDNDSNKIKTFVK